MPSDDHVTGANGGYAIGSERYVPDVAYISTTRQPQFAREDGYNPNPPELAVEVLSPSDQDNPRHIRIKISNYLAVGTVVWVVDPDRQQVEVYTPGQAVSMVDINGTLDGGSLLPGFSLPVREIFPSEAGS